MRTIHAPESAGTTITRSVRLVAYAWGRQYLDDTLNYALAAALAPGNLPALSEVFDTSVAIVTEQRFFEYAQSHPTCRALKKVCPVKFIPLDDLISEPWQYGMTLTYSLLRGFEDLGSAATETYLLFLNSDFLLADGSYRTLNPRIRNGERAHLAPSYCTIYERVVGTLKARMQRGVLAVPHREMARMILDHHHHTIRAKTINQPYLEYLHTDQFYWRVDDNTLIGRQMPIALVGMCPERYVPDINTFWDWGVVYEFCPSRKLHVLGDSDDFLMLELRSENTLIDSILPGRTSPKEVAARTRGYITTYQLDNAKFPLCLHASDLPADMVDAEAQLALYVNKVLSYLPPMSYGHDRHMQWAYHKSHFRHRHERLREVALLG